MMPLLKAQIDKWRFGRYVRWYRTQRQLSLREASRLVGLSHTYLNRIEHGNAIINDKSYEKLLKIIPETTHNENEFYSVFDHLVMLTQRVTLHMEMSRFDDALKTFLAVEHNFSSHILWVDYKLYQMLLLHVYPKSLPTNHTTEINQLKALLPIMNDAQKQLCFLTHGAYLLFNGRFNLACDQFNDALAIRHITQWNPLINHLLGVSLSELNLNSSAESILRVAHQLCIQSNLFIPSVVNRIWRQLINFRMHYDLNAIDFNEAFAFAQRYELIEMKNIIAFNHLIYYLRKMQYGDALKIIDILPVNHRTYYYNALCLMRLNKTEAALNIVFIALQNLPTEESMTIYVKGLRCIQAHLMYPMIESHQYERALHDFFMLSMAEYAMEENQFVYPLYRDFLKQQRRYKDAYQVTRSINDHITEKGC